MAKTIKIDHIYSMQGIYDALYNRSTSYKMGEATAFATIMENFRFANKIDGKKHSILEMFSGIDSYHKEYFLQNYVLRDKVEAVFTADMFAEANDTNLKVNVVDGEFGRTFDAIFAYYYSLASLGSFVNGKLDAIVKRETTQALLQNVYKHLNKGGMFIFDHPIGGYQIATEVCVTDSEAEEYEKTLTPIHRNHTLRKDLANLGIKTTLHDSVWLETKYDSVYDRMTGNNIDTFEPMKVYVGKGKSRKLVLTIQIDQPFCMRYYSEPEMVDMIKAAGFKSVQFWSCEYNDHEFEELSRVVKVKDHIGDDVEDIIPNVYVCIK